jgi:hypothetical protein
MRLVSIMESQRPDNVKRITGTVEYQDQTREEYWFDIPAKYYSATSGNPWLAILLPLAASLGENLSIPLPVDRQLLLGAESIVRLWHHWRPAMHLIAIDATILDSTAPVSNGTASFFSAGVDSTFTVLRRPDVKHWITVLGFDMPVSRTEEFRKHCARLAQIAADFGATFIPVATNIRETRWKTGHWELISHGPALAAVALMFEDHFAEVLIPASYDYTCLDPWGSHPLADPLFSTHGTKIIHEGTAYTRTEKIEYLSTCDRALSELHVCYRGSDARGQDHTNCGRCEKCYRTMIALDIFGKLDDAKLFDRATFDIPRIAKIYVSHQLDEKFFIDLERTAIEHGRRDIAVEIGRCMRSSKRIKKLEMFSKVPGAWRIAQSLTKYLLRDSPR